MPVDLRCQLYSAVFPGQRCGDQGVGFVYLPDYGARLVCLGHFHSDPAPPFPGLPVFVLSAVPESLLTEWLALWTALSHSEDHADLRELAKQELGSTRYRIAYQTGLLAQGGAE